MKLDKKVRLKDFLTEEYLSKCLSDGLSLQQIAQKTIKLNRGTCSTSTIHYWLRRYGLIPDRPNMVLKNTINIKKAIDVYGTVNNTTPITIKTIKYDPEKDVKDIIIMISDIQIGACSTANGYDPIPEKTIEKYINVLCINLIELFSRRKLNIKNINIFLLGDIVDGELIYPRQRTINMGSQLKIAVKSMRQIIETIRPYADNIKVYTVAGNHGRVTKLHNKSSNWDNIVYDSLELIYENDKDVVIDSDRSFVKNTKIGKWTFLYTHGDIIRGMITRQKAINKSMGFSRRMPHDAFLMGHFHTVMFMDYNRLPIVINGCMYDSELIQNELAGWETKRMVVFKVGEGNYPIDWLEMIDIE